MHIFYCYNHTTWDYSLGRDDRLRVSVSDLWSSLSVYIKLLQLRQTKVVKTGSDRTTVKRLKKFVYHRTSEMTIVNRCPVSQ